MTLTDSTHDPNLASWVESAQGHADFPIQNLPFGVFDPGDGARIGCAIGDHILDLQATDGIDGHTLNALIGDTDTRAELRRRLSRALSRPSFKSDIEPHLYPAHACRMVMPFHIGDYTDFYAGIHHARRVGALFRPEAPLLPNYKHLPIGYHGRASSVVVSGTDVIRPNGQRLPPGTDTPVFGPSKRLDIELEFGAWVGSANALGQPVPIDDAWGHIGGFCLLNDWSARDLQAFEYQPLGPFLAKSFATTVSPWVITPEALAPFRRPQPARPEGDPEPLAHLRERPDALTALSLDLEAMILTPAMRAAGLAPHALSHSHSRHLYWTFAQMLAHHTSNGCNLLPGDLLGSGTISGPEPEEGGSLLELTQGGRTPITLPNGETRTFLDDGDEVILTARARRDGFVSIGFGDCRGRVLAAPNI